MKRRQDCERGSAAMLAIFAMLFLGMIIAGLLPMLTMESRSAASDRDALQARYAAEAGVKRAYAAMSSASSDWSWNTTNPQSPVVIPLGGNNAAQYWVTIGPAPNPTQPPTPGIYTITSTGSVGGITKTAYGSIKVLVGGGVAYDPPPEPPSNWGGGNGANPPPLPSGTLAPYPSYNVGTSLTISNNVTITGGNFTTGANTITNNSGLPVVTGVNFPVPTVPVSLTAKDYQSGSTSLGSNPPSGNYALNGAYYASNGFTTDSNSVLQVNAPPGQDATIFVNGPVIINSNVDVTTGTGNNFILISNSSITINSNVELRGNIQIYAKDDIILGSNVTLSGFGLIMANRDVTLNAGVTLNKAVVSAGRDMIINSNDTITGEIMAGRNLTINSNATINLAQVL